MVKVEESIRVVEKGWTAWEAVQEVVANRKQEEAFFVLDLGDIVDKYRRWKEKLPRVEPHYAVKCSNTTVVLEVLAALGAGFDCASRAEIDQVLEVGVNPERIIFANPAKPTSHVRHALATGVNLMTFDSEFELLKIKQHHPGAKLVVRIRCDAKVADYLLGAKYGCDSVTEAPRLLRQARDLELEVVGVSFHVGSGCREPEAFSRAISLSADVFRTGNDLGHPMALLDIGGGFPGYSESSIDDMAAVVNSSLERHFPVGCGVRVIAEPGRFFVASAFTLACSVHSKRHLYAEEGGVSQAMYFLNDGVYGSFNRLTCDSLSVTAIPLKSNNGKKIPSTLWGPTCTNIDRVTALVNMQPMEVGDWVVFRDMGDYSLSVACSFNGFPVPKVTAYGTADLWAALRKLPPISD